MPVPMLYAPVVCLVLSGSKQLSAGCEVVEYGAGQYLIATAHVPTMARICVDEGRQSYLSLTLSLNAAAVSEVAGAMSCLPSLRSHAHFGVATSDELLLDAWRRMCELLGRPDEIPFLAPLIEKEILFRLLAGPQAHLLSSVFADEPAVRQIRSTAAWIRENYSEPIKVESLAKEAGMSVTVFHRRFKEVMSMSPLQYQKTVRLYEARERLVRTATNAARVAYSVGYESASQFSREYKRLFGLPPSADLGQQTAKFAHALDSGV